MKNVLIILTDQQRKDSLGCYGNDICRTPNLDRLASRGIRFERNYVANPICMPNRLSIFTGKNIRNHALWTNGLNISECETLPDWFCAHGYQTASIGKIHFKPYGEAWHGDVEDSKNNMESIEYWEQNKDQVSWHGPYWGFEHVELTLGHTSPLAHYGEWFYKNGGTDEMLERHPVSGAPGSGIRKMPESLHDSAFVADRTINYLKNTRNKDKPFFLVASFPDPHHPFNPPEETSKSYSPDNVRLPFGGPDDLQSRPEHYTQHFQGAWHRQGLHKPTHENGWSEPYTRERIAHTYAMVDLIDRNIGKILDSLTEEGLRDDTIIVFTSDHGELLGDHGLWAKGPFFYESLINTPLIISSPGQVENRVSDTLFSDLDIAPTLCELAGVPFFPFMDGISQVPHLVDSNIKVRNQCLVEYRNGYGDNDCSAKILVSEKLKYVRYQNGAEELTDLTKDPNEHNNVVGKSEYNKVKTEIRSRLLDEILSTEQKGPVQVSHA